MENRENGVIPDRENTGNLKIFYRNLKSRKYVQKKMLRHAVTLMILFLMFKMSFYYENTQGKLKLHREIIEKTQEILLFEISGNHDLAAPKIRWPIRPLRKLQSALNLPSLVQAIYLQF